MKETTNPQVGSGFGRRGGDSVDWDSGRCSSGLITCRKDLSCFAAALSGYGDREGVSDISLASIEAGVVAVDHLEANSK